MANKLYSEDSIKAIADAIREVSGSTDTYTVAEMSIAIRTLFGGNSDYFTFELSDGATLVDANGATFQTAKEG